MHKLSICIPTFNRCSHLSNCLNSIILNTNYNKKDVQICVSDNCSTDETEAVVLHAQKKINIIYRKHEKNLGMSRNFLNVVDMANGEYVWIIGDDDLLMPSALKESLKIIDQNNDIDFFYINSFHLTTEFVLDADQPFDTKYLPIDMKRFSKWKSDGVIDFFDLINPQISFDFLGGIFLSIFKREKWMKNSSILEYKAIHDDRVFSHFDNTFPHVKIFAKSFSNSKAYFHSSPLSVCLTGAREWAPMYPFIRSVRLVEVLDEYKKNGLPYNKYVRCKSFALRNFIPDMVYTFLNKKESGSQYVEPLKLFSNTLYPTVYLSFFRYFIRKFKSLINK
jgi:glycosyltransferase involved in cell wall biosynthesis